MKLPKKLIMGAILALLFIGCTKAPITGRNQFIMIDKSQEMKLGYQSAQQVLKKEKISTDRQKTAMVKRVGQRIANVSGQKNFKWAFYLIDNDKQANAFCLPGGKVFVYTGLFKYIANDDELAAVMGHEIGHAIARHGAERMSRGQLAQMSGAVLQAVMIGKGNPAGQGCMPQNCAQCFIIVGSGRFKCKSGPAHLIRSELCPVSSNSPVQLSSPSGKPSRTDISIRCIMLMGKNWRNMKAPCRLIRLKPRRIMPAGE